MITASRTKRQPDGAIRNWQQELAEGFRRPEELLRYLGLSDADLPLSAAAMRDFPMRVPRSFAARMQPGKTDDPLLRQVLPLAAESETRDGFVMDPVGDMASRQADGLLKKYRGRALLITTGACAIHCRYCFRRHFPYNEQNAGRLSWQPALEAVAADRDINEIILSGGDPLSLADQKLQPLVEGLGSIAHIHRLRVHTRLPVVLPSRVTDKLVSMLRAFPGPVTVVLHINHGREIDEEVVAAVQRLQETGALLLNQAVLLKGVNDSVEALSGLSEKLTAMAVSPYYLHQLDPVAGAAHFEVNDERALALMEAMRERLPGYMLPRLVREIPEDSAKRPVVSTGK
jgi:L-lysine 2,3-aminomutase